MATHDALERRHRRLLARLEVALLEIVDDHAATVTITVGAAPADGGHRTATIVLATSDGEVRRVVGLPTGAVAAPFRDPGLGP